MSYSGMLGCVAFVRTDVPPKYQTAFLMKYVLMGNIIALYPN
jgi:hypothetical protein